MTLDQASTLRLGRRLGFGLRPEEEVPSDLIGWAVAQLTAQPPQLGVASIVGMRDVANTQKPPIVPWPDKYLQPLEAQVARTIAYQAALEALDKKVDPSSPDYEAPRLAIEQKFNFVPWDMTRRTHQAIYGSASVLERFAHFWANHFTVAPKDHTEHIIGHYLEMAIRANLGGDFATMLNDVTMHPAMQVYLDNVFSVGPNSKNGKYSRAHGKYADINENLARELLELHTLSPAGGYTQDDIIGIARILTGWGYVLATGGDKFPGKDRWRPFFTIRHEPGSKAVLGETYKQGPEATTQLLARLAAADATIEHLSSKLARYFLADAPDPTDIAAIAETWRQNNGNLPAIHQKVIKLVAAKPELRKFQQPEIWLYQCLRSSGADLFLGFDQVRLRHDASESIDDFNRGTEILLGELGQYYWQERQPNGYSDARADWVSPEHMDRRLRFSELIAAGGRPVLAVDALSDRLGVGAATRALVAQGQNDTEKFVLLLCSPDVMEA